MSGPLPRIVASVLNWNTPALTLRCLRALAACDYPALQIVVVDNASDDDSVATILAAWPTLAIVQAATNLGFGEGHALAWHAVRNTPVDAIWLLNSDAAPDTDALHALVAAWREHGDAIYGAAPLRQLADGRTLLDVPASFLASDGVPRAFARDRPIPYDDDWAHAAPRAVAAVLGSCMLLPRNVVETHGWFDPAWFLYCEEIDYCLRLRRLGVARWLVPQARVRHDGGGSSRAPRVADAVAYYHARNEIELARRHAGHATAAAIASKKFLRALSLLFVRPRRAAFVARGAFDGVRRRLGKIVAPEPRHHA